MYLNAIWSVLLIAAVIAVWFFVIRPRLKVPVTDIYEHVPGFWARVGARVYAFRSYVATLLTAIIIGAPDIAVAFLPLDLSGIVGTWWAQLWTTVLTVYLALNRAFSTKPRDEPA